MTVGSTRRWEFLCLFLVLWDRARGVPTNSLDIIPQLTVKDKCDFVGRKCYPDKKHKPTMLINVEISDTIEPREPGAFMVEEAQTSHVRVATKLLPSILIGSSGVDSVECSMF